MSSQSPLPTPETDYAAPAGMRVNPATWNFVFGSLGARLRALEAQKTALAELIEELQIFGLQRLDEAILPLIEQQQAALASLSELIDTEIARISALFASFETQSEEALEQLQAQITAAVNDLNSQIAGVEEQINIILAGGIPADDVAESATRVFVSPEQKAEIGQLRTDVNTKTPIDAQTISSKVTSTANARLIFKDLADNIRSLFSLDRVTNAWSVITRHPTEGDKNKLELSGSTAGALTLNGKKVFHEDNVATQAQAEGGTASGVPMDPLRSRQAIAALAGDVTLEKLTTSGTFSKAADDLAYLIVLFGGGAGGGNIIATGWFKGGWPGQRHEIFLLASEVGASTAFTVGAGGLGTPSGTTAASGGEGGDTTFGDYFAKGGLGGGSASGVVDFGDMGSEGYSSHWIGLSSTTQLNQSRGNMHLPTGGGSGRYATSPSNVTQSFESIPVQRAGRGGNGNASAGQRAGDGEVPGGGGGSSARDGGGGNGARGEIWVYRFKRIKQ